MEWVETTADTLEAAKNLALDQLGVSEEDAEFDVLEEPKPGLFGRTRGEARVRARVRPTAPRSKPERRDRGPKRAARAEGDAPKGRRGPKATAGSDRPRREPRKSSDAERAPRPEGPPVDPATVSAAATTFLEGMLTAAGLVGQRGATLMAVQDLTRVVSQRRLGDHDTHMRVDIGSYRERRREALSRFALKVADDVLATGQPRVLEPMNSADRKIVHDALVNSTGVSTHSQGQDPHRRVVVALAETAETAETTE